jgi:lysophospholipase L1-like esterase
VKARSLLVPWIVALGLAVLAGGCSNSAGGDEESVGATTVPPEGRSSVAIVGDSITEQGQDILLDRLSDAWNVSVDGKSGYRVLQQLRAAAVLAQAGPTQAIINLGTNDLVQGRSAEEISADLGAILAEFPDTTCVHVVNLAEGIGGPDVGRDLSDAAVAANRAIRDLAARHEGVGVVDWAGALHRYEDDGEPDGPMLADTVHPTEVGQHALADLYEEALGSCGG